MTKNVSVINGKPDFGHTFSPNVHVHLRPKTSSDVYYCVLSITFLNVIEKDEKISKRAVYCRNKK